MLDVCWKDKVTNEEVAQELDNKGYMENMLIAGIKKL